MGLHIRHFIFILRLFYTILDIPICRGNIAIALLDDQMICCSIPVNWLIECHCVL